MSWHECTLGDVVTLKRGHDLPNDSRLPGDVPVVSSSGFTGYHNEAKAEPPGVVTGRYGTIGEVFFVAEPYWPLNTALYAIDFHGNDPRFVAYFLRNQLRNYQSDKAAVPGVDRNVLHKIPVRCPDQAIQQRIVSTLSAYDDLIENNRRRITLLEEAARLLYREWFVHFRFPGHEHVKIVDGVPEGWAYTPMAESMEMVMGQSPKSEFYNTHGEGLPFHQGVTNYGFRFVSDVTYSTNITKLAEAGDILFSVRAPVGRINITLNRMVLGRGLAAFRSKKGNQSFLFYQLKSHFFKEDLIGGGAIYAATNKKELEKLPLLQPTDNLILTFEQFSKPIDEQIRALTIKTEQLIKARDLLLPRLMDGRLEV